MQKREKIIVAMVIVATLYGAIDFTLTNRKKKAAMAPSQMSSTAAADLSAQLMALSTPEDQKIARLAASINEPWPEQIFALSQLTFDTDKKVDENELALLNDLHTKAEELVYSGFVATESDRIAIINNIDYRIGEEINGFTITKITQESVQVSQQGNTFDIPATTEQAPELLDQNDPNPENTSVKALP